jgi:hypothetical protein
MKVKGSDCDIVTYKGLASVMITGSGFGDWVYCYFFTIIVNYNSSHIELLLNDVSLTNRGLISHCSLIYELTPIYNCHADRIQVTTSNC